MAAVGSLRKVALCMFQLSISGLQAVRRSNLTYVTLASVSLISPYTHAGLERSTRSPTFYRLSQSDMAHQFVVQSWIEGFDFVTVFFFFPPNLFPTDKPQSLQRLVSPRLGFLVCFLFSLTLWPPGG